MTWRTLVPTSQKSAQIWRYTTNKPSADWLKPRFDDYGWTQGKGGLGSPGTPGAVIGTEWRTSDIWIRRTFRADTAEFALIALKLHHDEDTEIYLNGQRVAVDGKLCRPVSLRITALSKTTHGPSPNVHGSGIPTA